VEFSLQSFQKVLGYAQTGYRLACLLVVIWKANERCGIENSAYLPLLVLMEGNKRWCLIQIVEMNFFCSGKK
jgi:hypothetical protein